MAPHTKTSSLISLTHTLDTLTLAICLTLMTYLASSVLGFMILVQRATCVGVGEKERSKGFCAALAAHAGPTPRSLTLPLRVAVRDSGRHAEVDGSSERASVRVCAE